MATTRKKSTTKPKTATAKPTAPEPEAQVDDTQAADAPGAVAVQGVTRALPSEDNENAGKLVKKDLVDRVIARSGVKPRYVRQVIDAMLVELGGMLEEAETLQLQPLGNLKVQRRKDVDDGEVIITKVKRKKPDTDGKDPLAAAAE